MSIVILSYIFFTEGHSRDDKVRVNINSKLVSLYIGTRGFWFAGLHFEQTLEYKT